MPKSDFQQKYAMFGHSADEIIVFKKSYNELQNNINSPITT